MGKNCMAIGHDPTFRMTQRFFVFHLASKKGAISKLHISQGSHSHGKSRKAVEKCMVMESHGKVMENHKTVKSRGKVKISPFFAFRI